MRIVVVLVVMLVLEAVIVGLRRPRGERRVRVDVGADQVRELLVVVSPVAKWPASWGAR